MKPVPVLQPFVENWAEEQRRLLEQIRPLTMEQMQLRPAPGEYAIWQLGSNMVGGRLYWLCFMLGEDDLGVGGMFRDIPPEYPGWEDYPDRPRSADEIVTAFLRTWTVVESCLDRWTEADLLAPRTRPNFWGQEVTITPAQVLWKLMTHEAHHGAEITAILRVNGLPTSLNW